MKWLALVSWWTQPGGKPASGCADEDDPDLQEMVLDQILDYRLIEHLVREDDPAKRCRRLAVNQ